MKLSYRNRWYHFFWRWLYSLILLMLMPLLCLKLMTKKANATGLIKHKNRQRFGFTANGLKKNGVIVHCVSMGEVNAAQGIIEKLIVAYPSMPVTVTTTSVTGAEHAVKLFADRVQHSFLPIDFPVCIWLFLRRLKPKMLMVTEVEIWPNLLHQCYQNKIPAILINARMTDRSLINYKRLAYLFRPSLRKFTCICAQAKADFENFVSMGVYKTQLVLTNNLKFDLQANPEDEQKAKTLIGHFGLQDKTILLAASTHDGEEKVLIDCYASLKASFEDLVLCIVPRYPHRFNDVIQLVNASGLNCVSLSAAAVDRSKKIDVAVIDKMGMLKAAYSISNMAFVGGSLVSKGGHNPLEGALYQVPMCMGPSVFNNPAITSLLKESKALTIVQNQNQIVELFGAWLVDTHEAVRLGAQGKKILAINAGALELTLSCVQAILKQDTARFEQQSCK